jgi:glycosyltransferase involved in cell wall biosynthesis
MVLPPGVAAVRIHRHAPGRLSRVEHDVLLPFDLRRVHADVVHSPAQSPPLVAPAPWVQTLHDAVQVSSSNASERRRWRRTAARIRRAAAVIAVSEWSARTGVELLGLDPRKVHVVRHGIDERFRPAVRRDDEDEDPYVLFVGEYDPRKRHELAFAVIARLADLGLPHRLVVTGRIAPWYEQRLRDLVAASPRPDLIELTGYVDDTRLLDYYQRAAAVLVTSSAEGFGFPALEAMACGTPVAAFANSATAELLDAAALLAPDGDVDRLARAMFTVLSDHNAWQDASAAALQRASLFSWSESVRRHVDIFMSVAR